MQKSIEKIKKSFMIFIAVFAIVGMFSIISCDNGSGNTMEDSPDNPSLPGTEPSTSGVSITFNENNGSENPKTVTKNLSLTDNLPSADELEFCKEGSTFVGWGTSVDANSQQTVSSDYPGQLLSENKTSAILYAVWDNKLGSEDFGEEYAIGSFVLADGTIIASEVFHEENEENPVVGIIAYGKESGKSPDLESASMIRAKSKKDVYMISIYAGLGKSISAENTEGAEKEILPCTIGGVSGVSGKLSDVKSFTGETDGKKFADTLKSKVTDSEKEGNYTALEWASSYSTKEGWEKERVDNPIVIPNSSKYASGWFVPSIAELCIIYKGDVEYGESKILKSLEKLQNIRHRGPNGREDSHNNTAMMTYKNIFQSAFSCSDASASTVWRIDADVERFSATVRAENKISTGAVWVVHSLE